MAQPADAKSVLDVIEETHAKAVQFNGPSDCS
jgi:hypothetical protein